MATETKTRNRAPKVKGDKIVVEVQPRSDIVGSRATKTESVPKFEGEIKQIKDAFDKTEKDKLQTAIDMGGPLKTVRDWIRENRTEAEVGKTWASWCSEKLPIQRRQADRYISLFDNKDKIKEAKSIREALDTLAYKDADSTNGRENKPRFVPFPVEGGGVSTFEISDNGKHMRLSWKWEQLGHEELTDAFGNLLKLDKEFDNDTKETVQKNRKIIHEGGAFAVRASAEAFRVALANKESARQVSAILSHLETRRREDGSLDKVMESLGVEQPAQDKGPSFSV